MITNYDLKTLRETLREWRREGLTVALVPTMGNLHDGHISLLARAREIADRSVVSIFVNPIQFGRGEDYERYPSTLDADRAKLEAAGLDLLFAPNLAELYPGGIEEDTRVTVPALSDILCGEFRPGHFSGVATVVSKLFINTQPDFALFGEKDFQQVMVIRRMVRDLLFPVKIIGMPIIREADGLAMSSRNSYLKPAERQVAAGIFASLTRAATELREQTQGIAALEQRCVEELTALGMRPEYISVRSALDLSLPKAGDQDLIILAAAWLGGARLIDNVRVMLSKPLAA
ncbi:MAG: pantoate--beta-alanine ligase [Proteobacteria bacterium]|nr:pantoate--beta-alanine ligase [Pseudomonadota bacterium]MBK8958139.1 pantoate--beta-alanine ligase [Pseudomonadota bacterium]